VINPFAVDPHPLIVRTNTIDWIYPKWGEDVLRFETGEVVDLLCPGREIIVDVTSTGASILVGTCVSDNIFSINGIPVRWDVLSCSGGPVRSIRNTGNSCSGSGREQEAGFDIGDGRFLRSLLICFNWDLQIAYYTYIDQTASINQRVLGTPRPSWVQGTGMWSIGTVTNLYLRVNQKASVNGLLGLPADSTKYIHDTGNWYLARGHMTARSDGFYAAQQNATFYMQNIAPQWQNFNGINWYQIEVDTRDFTESLGLDLQIWTGVHGVTTLPHEETGLPTELYLVVNETHRVLPVPQIFYKVLYEPVSKAGVALIGVNNPYIEEFTPICPDISGSLSWFRCNSGLVNGYCYACTVPTFKQVVTVFPDIDVQSLLS